MELITKTIEKIFNKVDEMTEEVKQKYWTFEINNVYLTTEYDDWEWDDEYNYVVVELSNWQNIRVDTDHISKLRNDSITCYSLSSEYDKKQIGDLNNKIENNDWVIILEVYIADDWKQNIQKALIFETKDLYNKLFDKYIKNINKDISISKQDEKQIKQKFETELNKYFEKKNQIDWSLLLVYLYHKFVENIKKIKNEFRENNNKDATKSSIDYLENQINSLNKIIQELK